jgi:hypothetical protein
MATKTVYADALSHRFLGDAIGFFMRVDAILPNAQSRKAELRLVYPTYKQVTVLPFHSFDESGSIIPALLWRSGQDQQLAMSDWNEQRYTALKTCAVEASSSEPNHPFGESIMEMRSNTA